MAFELLGRNRGSLKRAYIDLNTDFTRTKKVSTNSKDSGSFLFQGAEGAELPNNRLVLFLCNRLLF